MELIVNSHKISSSRFDQLNWVLVSSCCYHCAKAPIYQHPQYWLNVYCTQPGAHFIHHFSITIFSNTIQIWWKIDFSVTPLQPGYYITTKFCTCHDSTAVMPCTKFHSDHFTATWMRAECNFHGIWITMEKLFVKLAPVSQRCITSDENKVWT